MVKRKLGGIEVKKLLVVLSVGLSIGINAGLNQQIDELKGSAISTFTYHNNTVVNSTTTELASDEIVNQSARDMPEIF